MSVSVRSIDLLRLVLADPQGMLLPFSVTVFYLEQLWRIYIAAALALCVIVSPWEGLQTSIDLCCREREDGTGGSWEAVSLGAGS